MSNEVCNRIPAGIPCHVRLPVLSWRWLFARCCCAVSLTAGIRLPGAIDGTWPYALSLPTYHRFAFDEMYDIAYLLTSTSNPTFARCRKFLPPRATVS